MREFYNYTEIDSYNANYNIILSSRSDGKTYGAKQKMIDNFVNNYDSDNKGEFALLRFTRENISTSYISQFFNDISAYMEEKLKERFPSYAGFYVKSQAKDVYIYGYDQDEMSYNLGKFGTFLYLTKPKQSRGKPYEKTNLFVFDECMTRDIEPPDVFRMFMDIVSSVRRNKKEFKVYMLGNPDNTRSTLLKDMGIDVTKLQQGKITCFKTPKGNTIAVDFVRKLEKNEEDEAFFDFQNSKTAMITDGVWDIDTYPCMTEDDYNVIRKEHPMTCFVFVEDETHSLYAYPCRNTLYILTKRLPNYTCQFISIGCLDTAYNRMHFNWQSPLESVKNMKNFVSFMYYNGQVKYADNMTGDSFEQFLKAANSQK